MKAFSQKSQFFQNIVLILGSSSFAQFIPIIFSPILTRIYTPENFGIFGIYVAIVSILSVVISFRYELAILLPKDETNAIHILVLTQIISAVNTLFYLALAIILSKIFERYDLFPNISEYLLFLPLNAFILGITQGITFWLNQSALTVTVTLILGYFKFGARGLILGWLSGQILFIIPLVINLLIEDKYHFGALKLKQILYMAKTYKNFPKINTIHALVTSFTVNLPVIIIEKFFSPYAAGLYMLCIRVVYTPISLISTSLSQVINPYLAKLYNAKENVHEFMKRLIKKLLFFSGAPFILMIFFATLLFRIIFGNVWTEAGKYFQLLSPFFFMSLLTSPFSFIPMIVNLQKKAFYIELIYLVLRLCGFFIGIYFMNIEIALILYSISGVMVLSYNLNWYLNLAKGARQESTVLS